MAIEQKTRPDVLQIFSDLILALVDDTEHVSITLKPEIGGGTVIEVKASQSEFGNIIGSGGRSARALRTLLSAVSMGRGQRYILDVQSSEWDQTFLEVKPRAESVPGLQSSS